MQNDQLHNLRHSCAHLLAAAVLELWPHTKRTIGPPIEDGFYYDFDFGETKISEEDLQKIEEKMRQILPTWDGFTHRQVSKDEALAAFHDNPYKQELINEFAEEGQTLTLYTSGNYTDLCRGGHVESPASALQHFKLLSVAGAYWRGKESNPMLTRIYGTCFPTQEELANYLIMIEEAKKRDHRKLGKELGLFVFSDLVGPGLPLWTPKGTIMRNLLHEFVWSLRKRRGYQQVTIPHITKKELYETSGHWEKYMADLFKITTREGHLFAMKPMNCPHHTQIYASELRSYRDLPVRYAETTMVYRDEQSGELSGLFRVLSITQDDAHVFCRMSQVRAEAEAIWDIVKTFYGAFGFELTPRLSRRDPKNLEKYLGASENWDYAEAALREILDARVSTWIDGPGEAAFYGPKIDFMAKDSIGRVHQVATIQLDFIQPKNFGLTCVNEKGESEPILMVHCAIMGSIERCMGILIEHLAGAFPLWLAPVQVRLASVSEDFISTAQKFADDLRAAGVRVEVDASDEKVGKKIRNAAIMKVPWTIVVGGKEAEGGDVHVRVFGSEEELAVPQAELVERLKAEAKLPTE